jgi:phosphoribosylglycinamide formyltransferase 2
MRKKIMLLGSGELGKEFTIAAQRLGQYIIAVDSYTDAPAMQVAHESEVIDMLDGDELDRIVFKHQPDLIVPEIEAIRTEKFYQYEEKGFTVVPSAKAANFTMNRKAIRDLAAMDLGIKTAKYRYADSLVSLQSAASEIGYPCVIKPLMSSSGKGQSLVKDENELQSAWSSAQEKSRGDINEVIVEEFISFDYEITLLTLTQYNGETLFCPPIGHRQVSGDYVESWQPMPMNQAHLKTAEQMAKKVTKELTGNGIWGVEFFISEQNGVYFSELSPRPHDTGMVTLANTQNFNEFELHLRAILKIPVQKISLERIGVSKVLLANAYGEPRYEGIEQIASIPNTDVRIFGKQEARPNRRMGVVLGYDTLEGDLVKLKHNTEELQNKISVISD